MTTRTWTDVTDHTTDAGFRAWGSRISTELQAAGLTQTADTGQINWTTVTRASVNTDAGYEVYYLNDSLHGSAPVYFRLNYGTGSVNSSQPRLMIAVGTGTNGSGTLTGTALATATEVASGTPNAATGYQSYLCVASGFVGLAWNSTSGAPGFFSFCRTVDATGAFTTEGGQIYWKASFRTLRFAATANAYAARTASAMQFCIVPNQPTSSLVGSDFQVYQHWMATPRVRPNLCMCTVVVSEVNLGATFSATMVGSTPHTYLSLGNIIAGEPNGTSTYGSAMLWE